MADNELQEAREAYKAATGKNPAPNMDVAKLREKIAEAAASVAVDDPSAPAAAADEAAAPAADAAAANEAEAERAEIAKNPKASPHGTCYVAHPEKIGASYAGHELVPDENGHILVSTQMAEELFAHGFQVVTE